jgi:hypothetical protein
VADRLPELLRARAASALGERRRSRRYPAVEDRAWLGWWRNERDYSIVAARLIDISRGGARVAMAEPPPRRQAVWVCLGAPRPIDCVRATTLEATRVRQGEYSVRLEFHGNGPDILYRAAVHGLAPGAQTDRQTPSRSVKRSKAPW